MWTDLQVAAVIVVQMVVQLIGLKLLGIK